MEDNTLNDNYDDLNPRHGASRSEEQKFDQVWDEEYAKNFDSQAIPGGLANEKDDIWKIIAAREGVHSHALARRRLVRWLAVAATLVVLGVAGIQVYRSAADESAMAPVGDSMVVYSGKNYVKLSDGTTVELNEGSTLSYSPDFGIRDRIVYLNGQGYFDVAHDPAKPFRVKSGEIVTTVLGTAFDVRAYFNQGEVTVTVTRGKVSVGNVAGEKFGDLLPNQQITYRKGSNKTETRTLIAEKELEWKSDFLILDDVTVEDAVQKIAERFNSRMAFHDSRIKACKINVAFVHGESLDQIMEVLAGVTAAHYQVHNNVITVTGGEPCD